MNQANLHAYTTVELFGHLARLEASARCDRARDSAERTQADWRAVAAEIDRRPSSEALAYLVAP